MQSPSARFPLSDATNILTFPDLTGTKTPTLPKARSRIQSGMSLPVLPSEPLSTIDSASAVVVVEREAASCVLASDWVPNYENIGADDDIDESEEALLAMKSELDETKSQLSVEVAAREALQLEAAELRAKVAALEAAEAKSAHTIATLQGSVETLMADKASWEQQVIAKTSHMTAQLQTAQNEAEETVKAFNALHQRYEQMKKIHAVASKNETIMKQAIAKLQMDLQTATTAKETAEQLLADASKGVSEELAKVQREKILGESALHARIVRMEVQFETTAQELVIRSAQVEALQRICDELCEAAMDA